MPNKFEVHVEANINNRNYTVGYHVWYDLPHNQVATHVDNAGTKTEDLYRFDTNEFYHVDRDIGNVLFCPYLTINTFTLDSYNGLALLWIKHSPLVIVRLGFMSHQHRKGYMATFQRYWWRKTSDAPQCIISGTSEHLSRTTGVP